MKQQLCERHISDSDYVAKRFQDWWMVRNNPKPYTRAHYRRLYLEAYENMRKRVESCRDCRVEEVA